MCNAELIDNMYRRTLLNCSLALFVTGFHFFNMQKNLETEIMD